MGKQNIFCSPDCTLLSSPHTIDIPFFLLHEYVKSNKVFFFVLCLSDFLEVEACIFLDSHLFPEFVGYMVFIRSVYPIVKTFLNYNSNLRFSMRSVTVLKRWALEDITLALYSSILKSRPS